MTSNKGNKMKMWLERGLKSREKCHLPFICMFIYIVVVACRDHFINRGLNKNRLAATLAGLGLLYIDIHGPGVCIGYIKLQVFFWWLVLSCSTQVSAEACRATYL